MQSYNVDPRNRLNDLDSSHWLQFQKSWFYVTPAAPAEFITFFTKQKREDGRPALVGIFPENTALLLPIIESLGRDAVLLNDAIIGLTNWAKDHGASQSEPIASDSKTPQNEILPTLDYVLVDLCEIFTDEESYFRQAPHWLRRLQATRALMKPNSYLTLFLRNHYFSKSGPIAWEFGKLVDRFLTMKDEKIGCELADSQAGSQNAKSAAWKSGQQVVYCLNFRCGPLASPSINHDGEPDHASLSPLPALVKANDVPIPIARPQDSNHRAWFVVKPPRREKNVLLHPAKFPEPLIRHFIEHFSQPGERIFDPMAGTGSALVAALSCHREACGIELNPDFCSIIRQRLGKLSPSIPGLLELPQWRVCCGDASAVETYKELAGLFHYVITSPPYWDMLRMKGAETQQKRKHAGLLQYYSEDQRDLGNVADYEKFLEKLVQIYRLVGARLAPGRYLTVIVKNVKKRGRIFPLAWDLAAALSADFVFSHEQFWCQDDQKLSPFGYRYAWVSNTFHHYCLHFRQPDIG